MTNIFNVLSQLYGFIPKGVWNKLFDKDVFIHVFEQFLGSNVRICLCAPSNNAVDLLIKRLDDYRKKMVNTGMALLCNWRC